MVVGGGAVVLGACGRGGSATPRAATETASPSATEVVVGGVPGYDNPTVWEGRSIIVTSWGGEYEDAQQRAIFDPFERLTGVRIETAATSIQRLREQVEDGETTWDLCDVLTEDVLPLANLGVLEELDFNIIDLDGIFDDARMDHGIASSYYATILAYRTDAWPDRTAPSGWVDFWNVDAYPGTRGLHREAQGTLEFALLADGVVLDELYPLDLDRAFRSLDRIRDALTLWWEQGAQPAQMMSSGELDMVSAWHNRIERIRGEGASVASQWSGGALTGDSWVIPKDSANREIAMDLINFATRPEVCAAFASLVPFGPVNSRTFELLEPDVAERLPTAPERRELQFTVDHEWWFKHRESTDERFTEWLAEHP